MTAAASNAARNARLIVSVNEKLAALGMTVEDGAWVGLNTRVIVTASTITVDTIDGGRQHFAMSRRSWALDAIRTSERG